MKDQAEALRKQILQMVEEYFRLAHGAKEFIPGKSRLPYAGRVFDERELINLVDSSLEFWLTYGKYSERFEKGLAAYLGMAHCFVVNSGSSANLLAISALTSPLLGEKRLVPGDEVITVAAGFPTTVAPVIQNGLVPVFVDVTIPYYNVDCGQLEDAVSSRTKAVVLAHTLGNPFDIGRVRDFCGKHNLWLIEDNCDALGSRYEDRFTGTFGDIGTSSFYPPHHITMGEGGAVYTNDPLLARIITSLRDWGRDCTCPSGRDNTCGKRFSHQFGELPYGYDHKYVYSHFGYNLKVSDMQAAVGCAQLEKISDFSKKRKSNFAVLYSGLAHLEEWLVLPKATERADPCWFGFPMTVREGAGFSRDGLVRHLEKKMVQTRMLFAGNILRHPCFNTLREEKKGFRVIGELRNTDVIMKNTFWIGLYPGLNEEMLSYVIDQIDGFVRQRQL